MLFRQTERKLYNYFKAGKTILCIEDKINLLLGHVAEIRSSIKNTDIEIPEQSSSMNYGDAVQCDSVISYAERTAMKMIEDLENEIADKLNQITKLEKNIRNIQADNSIIEYNIKTLSESDKYFLKLKYGKEQEDYQVAQELNVSESTAYRIRKRLVENISRWERLINEEYVKK